MVIVTMMSKKGRRVFKEK